MDSWRRQQAEKVWFGINIENKSGKDNGSRNGNYFQYGGICVRGKY